MYEATQTTDLDPDLAFRALGEMDHWLTRLETITAVRQLGEGPFFVQGRKYEIDTPEGVTMHATLTTIDFDRRLVVIDAAAGPLRSHLVCRVEASPAGSRLTRTQAYPGLVGRLFTALKGKREAAETAAYLDAWIGYARELADH